MNRIHLVGAVGALSLALLVPASASAGEAQEPQAFTAQVTKAGCGHKGGRYGFGKVVIGMRGTARNDIAGAPTPNYVIVRTWHSQKIDGVWVEGDFASATSQTYPDGYGYTFQGFLQSAWHFPSADHPRMKMLVRTEFWDDLPTGDVLLYKVSTRTAAC